MSYVYTPYTLKIQRLTETAILPTRKHSNDAGLDFYSDNPDHYIPPHEYVICATGIAISLPSGFFGLVKPKSKLNYLIGAGIIDEGYTGELLVKIVNPYDEPLLIKKGSAICQLVVIPCIYPTVELLSSEQFAKLESERGATGGIATQLDIWSTVK